MYMTKVTKPFTGYKVGLTYAYILLNTHVIIWNV